MSLRLIILTFLTMAAFAANSVLCRLALVDTENNPISFMLVRLISGAAVLSFFFFKHLKSEPIKLDRKTLAAPALLFSYTLFFSLAYVQIGSGIGSLILFGTVQLTMMSVLYLRGQRLSSNEKLGFVLALCGFVYLFLPGLYLPPLFSAGLMVLAGISWGLYTLSGQGAANPTFSTARNFVLNAPLVILLLFIFPVALTNAGLVLAVLSGALTSGLGYVLWYTVLRNLFISTAAIVQLSVPVLSAFGGVFLLGEELSMRLLAASALIFAGIYLKVQKQFFVEDISRKS
jgi:drug/metabolite transporter (DMT)-like permease